MLDMRKVYSGTGANIGTATSIIKEWTAVDHTYTNVREFCQMGLLQWKPPGEGMHVINLDYYDLPREPYPAQHRYWFPEVVDGTNNGYDAMQIAPKCSIYTLHVNEPGEPMLVRYYFWTNREKLRSIPNYDSIAGLIMSCVTDTIDVIEPIPEGQWMPPIWKPLPSVLPTHPPDRRAVLLSAQIRS